MGRSGYIRVTPNEICDGIGRALNGYQEDVNDSVDLASDRVTAQLVEDIKEDAPAKTGTYRNGWTRKKLKYTRVVYNKSKPNLTHLLENGHAKRSGGRVEGIPHIGKNAKRADEQFEDLCVAIVSEGLRLTAK